MIKYLTKDMYTGETITVSSSYKNSSWEHLSIYAPKKEYNLNDSQIAIVIGNGISRIDFKLNLITNNFNTYGCNALYRDYSPTVLVVTGKEIADEVIESGYHENYMVYTNQNNYVNHQDKFNLIPQSPTLNAGAAAAYLAAFDGHKKIYMLGFDGIDTPYNSYNIYANTNGYGPITQNTTENVWVLNLYNIMKIYSDVEFIRVASTERFRVPDDWKYCLNFKTTSFKKFMDENNLTDSQRF